MKQPTDSLGLLDLLIQPGFIVQDNRITACNAAARGLLVEEGADVGPLLATGRQEYQQFTDGCLYLQVQLGGKTRGAAVLHMKDAQVFVLDTEEADRELSALALAAQVLRQPLAGVTIAADQLSLDPAIREQTGKLNRGLSQLQRIVNNMSDALLYRDFSRQETVNLTALFDEIFEKAQTLLAQAGFSLTYEGLREDVFALADSQQLERAVLNMLSNAALFPEAKGPITASLTRRGTRLHLSIQDEGDGIADDILNQIFRRYLRQPNLEDSRFGLGLGMVLIRNAAANHGGTVLIDRPGGTRVTLTMALRQSSEARLRSPLLRVDYAGERDHALLELSQVLPASMYEKK